MRFIRHIVSVPLHFTHLARGHTHRHLRLRNHLLTMFVATLVVDVVASYFMWRAERHVLVQPPGGANFGIDANWAHITDFWDSAFFTTTQLLTVSSLFNSPYSTAGRIIDVFLEAYGITIVGALAGVFGAFFFAGHRESQHAHESAGADRLEARGLEASEEPG